VRARRQAVVILIVNLVVFAVGLMIIELMLGAWLNPLNLNRLNLVKGRAITYDVSGLYEWESPRITYFRDRYGLRGAYGNDPGRIQLLTVGGSTTDQRYVPDGWTWQDVLQAQFAAGGGALVVANAGVDGQSTFGHIRNFDWWFPYVPHLKPDYILYYVGINDFYIGDGPSVYDALVRRSLMATLKDNSVFWHVARTVGGAYEAAQVVKTSHRKVDFRNVVWTDKPVQDGYAFLASRLGGYADRLRLLIDRTRRFGARPIFVTQPSRRFRRTPDGIEGRADVIDYGGHRINGIDQYHMMRQFDRVMDSVCRERNVPFLDIVADTDWTDEDFYDFNHMTPAGAAKLGRHLFVRLQPIVGSTQAVSRPR
jgi:lysophospholipase L1-like esterase